MGRIKIIGIKTLGNDLLKQHGDKFSGDFDKNKKALESIKEIESKRVRNMLAGYITRKMKTAKKATA